MKLLDSGADMGMEDVASPRPMSFALESPFNIRPVVNLFIYLFIYLSIYFLLPLFLATLAAIFSLTLLNLQVTAVVPCGSILACTG